MNFRCNPAWALYSFQFQSPTVPGSVLTTELSHTCTQCSKNWMTSAANDCSCESKIIHKNIVLCLAWASIKICPAYEELTNFFIAPAFNKQEHRLLPQFFIALNILLLDWLLYKHDRHVSAALSHMFVRFRKQNVTEVESYSMLLSMLQHPALCLGLQEYCAISLVRVKRPNLSFYLHRGTQCNSTV